MNEVDKFIEIFLLRIVNLLVAGRNRDITLTISDGNSAAVLRPSEAIERTISLSDGLSDDRYFSVLIDVPDVDVAFCVTRGENTRMGRTPSRIVHILLCALKGHEWLIT